MRRHLRLGHLAVAVALASCGGRLVDDGGRADGAGGSGTATGSSSGRVGGSAGTGGDPDDSVGAAGTAGQTASGGTTQTTRAGGSAGQTATGGTTQTTGTGGSGGAAEASCATNVTPCGGDVVGTWSVTSSCLTVSGEVDMAVIGLGCASAPVTGSLRVTGTWTANADRTFSDDTTTSGTETLELPASCLNVSGTTTTCNRIAGPFAFTLGYASVDCVESANGGCTCTAAVDQSGGIGLVSTDASASGNYTTAGNVITAAAGDMQYSYCVSASTLTMSPQSASPKVTTGTVLFQMQ
jgi:hypothetical protein